MLEDNFGKSGPSLLIRLFGSTRENYPIESNFITVYVGNILYLEFTLKRNKLNHRKKMMIQSLSSQIDDRNEIYFFSLQLYS